MYMACECIWTTCPPEQFTPDNTPLIFKQLAPLFFNSLLSQTSPTKHMNPRRNIIQIILHSFSPTKHMNPRLNIIQIILHSFIHYRINYSSFFYPLPSLKIRGELSEANCPWGKLSDIQCEHIVELSVGLGFTVFVPTSPSTDYMYSGNSVVAHSLFCICKFGTYWHHFFQTDLN